MATSLSKLSYLHLYEVLDRALDEPKGIRIRKLDYGSAKRLNTEFHTARSVMRDENRAMLEPGDPLYGRSTYDILTISNPRKVGDYWYVYIERKSSEGMQIESLVEVQEAEFVEVKEAPKLEQEEALKLLSHVTRR